MDTASADWLMALMIPFCDTFEAISPAFWVILLSARRRRSTRASGSSGAMSQSVKASPYSTITRRICVMPVTGKEAFRPRAR